MRNFQVLLLILLLTASSASAEIITYTRVVKKIIGTSQSIDDAKTFAVADAKRDIIEQAGTYIQSVTDVQNGELKKDDVRAIAAGIIKTEVKDIQNTMEGGSFAIVVTVVAAVDSNTVKEEVDRILNSEQLMSNYKDMEKKLSDQMAKVKELEEKSKQLELALANAKNTQDKKTVLEQIGKTNNTLQNSANTVNALDWFNMAYNLWDDKIAAYSDPQKAVDYFTKAMELDSTLTTGYYNRGIAYYNLNENDKAVDDYTTALSYTPGKRDVYYNRGLALTNLAKYNEAISDFNTAMSLMPNDENSIYSRAIDYYYLQNYTQAIADYSEAIRINPNASDAYFSRGLAYAAQGLHRRAIDDYNVSARLNPGYTDTYYSRALAYFAIGDYGKACVDAKKSCDMGSCAALDYGKANGWCR